MRYHRDEISKTANRINSSAAGLNATISQLNNVTPKKCASSFYYQRSKTINRIRAVQKELTALSTDIKNAAEMMSNDDAANARRIRSALGKHINPGGAGKGSFKGSVLAPFAAGSSYAALSYNSSDRKRYINKAGHKRASSTPWYSQILSWFKKEAKDIKAWSTKAKAYIWKSTKAFIGGEYADSDITLLSFGANILAGIFDVDLPLDIRDLVYDIDHWGEADNFYLGLALDAVALVPVIGAVKNVKYIDDLADGAKIINKASDSSKALSKADDIMDAEKSVAKAAKSTGAKDLHACAKGEYFYESFDSGKRAYGQLEYLPKEKRIRDNIAQKMAGGLFRKHTDQGGHLIGARFGGKSIDVNLFPQNQNFNQGAYKALENEWERQLKNGNKVFVDINVTSATNAREDTVMVAYTVVKQDGSSYKDYVSFTNESRLEQEEWDKIIDEFTEE